MWKACMAPSRAQGCRRCWTACLQSVVWHPIATLWTSEQVWAGKSRLQDNIHTACLVLGCLSPALHPPLLDSTSVT